MTYVKRDRNNTGHIQYTCNPRRLKQINTIETPKDLWMPVLFFYFINFAD